jgi:hypothetical protein
MKFLPIIVLIASACAVSGCLKENDDANINTQNLINSWVNSMEEETGNDVLIYRPSYYKEFYGAWFRQRFTLKENNKCVYSVGLAACGQMEVEGFWELKNEQNILIVYNKNMEIRFKFEIISLEPDMLRLKYN